MQLLPLEKGQLANVQLKDFIATFSEQLNPATLTAEGALYLGSIIVPAMEACFIILKSKLPKKPTAELKE